MTTTHTPGPWFVQRTGAAPRVRQGDGTKPGKLICRVDGADVGAWYDNAALIAAAPELLVALKTVTGYMNAHYSGSAVDAVISVGVEAIAKAEGR